MDRKWHPRTRPQDIRVGKYFVLYSQTAITRGIPNCPSSWTGIEVRGIKGLCQHILDPVVDEFGPVSVTFGFCSLELWKHWYPSVVSPLALHLFRPPQGGNFSYYCKFLKLLISIWNQVLCICSFV